MTLTAGARLPGAPEPRHLWDGYGGVTIAGDSWGSPNGPLVLLLHGGGQTRHAWRGTGEALARLGYYAVALDARGHGDSSWAPDGLYGHDVMIEDLKCVLSALGNSRPVLVGASMGGGVSLLAAGDGRMDVSGLVLVDVALSPNEDGRRRINQFMEQRPEGFSSLEEVADAIARYQPHRQRPGQLDGLAKNVRLHKDGQLHWHWDPRYRAARPAPDEQERRLTAAATALDVPTLLVRGGLSDILTQDGADKFLTLCPHSEYVQVPGAAHMVAGDQNDPFSLAVIEFLNRVCPAGSDNTTRGRLT